MSGYRRNSKPPYTPSCEENTFVQNFTSRLSSYIPAQITNWFSSPPPFNQSQHSNGSVSNIEEDVIDYNFQSAKRIKLSTSRQNLSIGPLVATSISDLETNSLHKKYTGNSLVETYLSSTDDAPSKLQGFDTPSNNHPQSRLYSRSRSKSQTSESSLEEEESSHKCETVIRSPDRTYLGSKNIKNSGKSAIDVPTWLQTSESLMKHPDKNVDRNDYMQNIRARQSVLGSPFYSGRTTYGGASSSYVNRPNIIQQKDVVVSETSKCDNTTSSSAQKVKDLLEMMSCPLAEARRIPTVLPDYSRENFLYRLRNMTPTPEPKNTSYYRTQEFHAPSIASVLSLKKRSRLMDTTKNARRIIASHSSTSDITPFIPVYTMKDPEKGSSKYTNKIKTSISKRKRGSDTEQQVVTEQPNIPTATLQIDKPITNLNFGITFTSSTPKSGASIVANSTLKENFTISKTTISTDKVSVEFSTPVLVSHDDSACKDDYSQEFNFVNPGSSIERLPANIDATDTEKTEGEDVIKIQVNDWQNDKGLVNNKNNKPIQKTPVKTFKPTESKGWQCADCWVNNKDNAEKCVCCGGKKPSKEIKPLKCTKCKMYDRQPSSEICELCQKTASNNTLPLPNHANTGKWVCSVCWVNNEVDANKCISCGEIKSKESPAPANNMNNAAATITAAAEEKWRCDTCWIQNNVNEDKCIACNSSKETKKTNKLEANKAFPSPLEAKSNKAETKSLDIGQNKFNEILVAQSLTWECPSCLVANDKNKLKCICCDQAKPGSEKETDNSFHFPTKSTVNFKFGIDPKAQTVASDNSNTKINEEPSETNNNVVSKVPTFSFGIPTKKPEIETPKDSVDSKTNSNFSFGIPSKLPDFGSTNKLFQVESSNAETNEKLQEVPKIDISALKPQEEIKNQPLKISPNLFTLPTATETSSATNKPPVAVLASVFGTPFEPDKKIEKPTAPITFGIPVTTTNSEPKTFTFSSNVLSKPPATVSETVSSVTLTIPTPSSMLSPTSTVEPVMAPTIISTTASFTLPAPTTFTFQKSISATPSLSLFQTPEPIASTPSLFQQKVEPVQATIGSIQPAPFFTFGKAPDVAKSPTEKPKYNFSFSKTTPSDTSPMFKFSATNNTEAKTNDLNSLPFGGGSVLGNTLTAGTGLPANASLSSVNTGETGMFSTTKDSNMWATNNNPPANIFGSPSNTQQNDKPFTFGSFGSAQTPSIFGTPAVNASGANLFGSPGPAPASQPSLFGSSSEASGMFGATASAFAAPNPSIPSFETPSLAQAPTPAFNFGATPSSGMFAFGQQGAAQSTPVYAFGGGAGAGSVPSLQFNMGSAPASSVPPRRMRKAARRTNR